ncbi:MAG: Hsp70 family protein [Gammaproteobacteria bacterium]|nr:Hsp70 family protein [Gammaproteobacteria bacterium]
MHAFCGLDFGTSNSTIGVGRENGGSLLVPLEGDKPAMRSAIFCDTEQKEWVFGQKGIDGYLEGAPGRLMMALKSVLGSPLMEDKTYIFNEYISYSDVLSYFMRHVKMKAEKFADMELTHVVLGRPVHFDDNDLTNDNHAQNTLEKIARDLGFKEVSFQYEPIAAAMTYEMSVKAEQLALIIDMGGGTSDFTIIRLRPNMKTADRSDDVLANCGIHIAGTDFDQRLSLKTVMPLLGMGSLMKGSSSDIEVPSMFYHDLTTWHTLHNLYGVNTMTNVRSIHAMAYEKQLISRLIDILKNRAGHHILDAVETTKQRLSDAAEILLDLDFIENDLSVLVQRELFNHVIEDQLQNILKTVNETVALAGVKHADINAIFYTGGSTRIPAIREKINAMFPQATVVQGDAFGSVGLGLTIDAQRKYGSSI